MAEKNVSVRLSARVDAYVAGMRKAQAATGLTAKSIRNMQRVGGQMQNVGRQMTTFVSLPIAAAGFAATRSAMQFEEAFAQMVGLAGVAAGEVDGLKESVLALSGETARSPQELADALYFAASAGLDSAEAMNVVDIAARTSAAGMGTTQDVVGLLATALAAYGDENITAARAADILTAAVREGRAEPEEMAAALGTVLPIASQLGIGFEEVAGATAFMSNVFGNTDETVVRLNGVLKALLDPSEQGRKALEDMGGSAEALRAAVDQDGLNGALEYLRSHGFAQNEQALGALFEDSRALQGALVLLNDESGRLDGIQSAVADSAGAAGQAFSIMAETDAFKMRQALADVQAAMISLGAILLPIVAEAAGSIAGLANLFADLPGPVQSVVAALAAVVAVGGPLIFIVGSLIKNLTTLKTAFGGAAGAMGTASKALGVIGIAATAAFLAWQAFSQSEQDVSPHIDTASDALFNQTGAAFAAAIAAGEATTAVDALAIANLALSNAIAESADEELSAAFQRLNLSSDQWLDTLVSLGTASDNQVARQRLFIDALGLTEAQAAGYFLAVAQGNDSLETLSRQTGMSVGALEEVRDALGVVTGFAIFNKDEVNALALAYLDAQVGLGGFARDAVLAAEATAGARVEAGNAVDVYMAYVAELANMDEATRTTVLSSSEFQDVVSALPPELQALIDGTEGAAGAVGELEGVQASSIDTMSRWQEVAEDAKTMIGIYADALDDALGNSRDWVRSHLDFEEALRKAGEEIDNTSGHLMDNTDDMSENRDAVLGLADDLTALTKSNVNSGKSQEEVNREYEAGREALLDAAEAAGLNRGEVEDLITAYGLTPELISTQIELAGRALAQWQIDRYIEKLDTVEPVVATQIEAAIQAGDIDEAIRLLHSIPDEDVAIRPYLTRTHFNIGIRDGSSGTSLGVIGISASAAGRYVDRPMISTLGEFGRKEVVLPLEDMGRMTSLLSMPQVGPAVAAAMPQPAPGHSTSLTIEAINVNDRRDIPKMVDALEEVRWLASVAT